MRFLARAQGESMHKWWRSVSSGRHGLAQGCNASLFVGPAHLLLLGHAVADDLVHR
jgi:hypothetical protein